MKKRHGITNDPERREKELTREFSGMSNFKVEGKFSTQTAAQKWENAKKNQHPQAGQRPLGQFMDILIITAEESPAGDRKA